MVVEVTEAYGSADAWHRVKDVSSYLTRHGIKIVSERVLPGELSTTKSLLRFVQSENVDLIVAGAYGHSRFGEWVFGGVTRELLAELLYVHFSPIEAEDGSPNASRDGMPK